MRVDDGSELELPVAASELEMFLEQHLKYLHGFQMDQRLSWRQKLPFVCFACRLVVKHTAPFHWEEYPHIFESGHNRPQLVFRCPRCSRTLCFLGRYFKAAPRSAPNQWRKVEALWRAGWRADGRQPCGARIKTLRDAREHLEHGAQPGASQQRRKSEKSQCKWKQARRPKP